MKLLCTANLAHSQMNMIQRYGYINAGVCSLLSLRVLWLYDRNNLGMLSHVTDIADKVKSTAENTGSMLQSTAGSIATSATGNVSFGLGFGADADAPDSQYALFGTLMFVILTQTMTGMLPARSI